MCCAGEWTRVLRRASRGLPALFPDSSAGCDLCPARGLGRAVRGRVLRSTLVPIEGCLAATLARHGSQRPIWEGAKCLRPAFSSGGEAAARARAGQARERWLVVVARFRARRSDGARSRRRGRGFDPAPPRRFAVTLVDETHRMPSGCLVVSVRGERSGFLLDGGWSCQWSFEESPSAGDAAPTLEQESREAPQLGRREPSARRLCRSNLGGQFSGRVPRLSARPRGVPWRGDVSSRCAARLLRRGAPSSGVPRELLLLSPALPPLIPALFRASLGRGAKGQMLAFFRRRSCSPCKRGAAAGEKAARR